MDLNPDSSRFEIIVTHESLYDAVSCGAVASRTVVAPGWVTTTFRITPIMSTYVTALVLTNYRYDNIIIMTSL